LGKLVLRLPVSFVIHVTANFNANSGVPRQHSRKLCQALLCDRGQAWAASIKEDIGNRRDDGISPDLGLKDLFQFVIQLLLRVLPPGNVWCGVPLSCG